MNAFISELRAQLGGPEAHQRYLHQQELIEAVGGGSLSPEGVLDVIPDDSAIPCIHGPIDWMSDLWAELWGGARAASLQYDQREAAHRIRHA